MHLGMHMKSFLSRHLNANLVLVAALLVVAAILLVYSRHTPAPAEPPMPYVERVTDQLHLIRVPDALKQEHVSGRVIVTKAVLRAAEPKALGAGNFTGVGFIVPGVNGLENYNSYFFQQARPTNRDRNIVEVLIAPQSSAKYEEKPIHDEQGAINRWLSAGGLKKYLPKEYLGMKCAQGKDDKSCIAEIRPGLWAHVRIDDESLRNGSYWPNMRVTYHTNAYGGLYITWNAFTEHVAKWREIDAKLWQVIRERNVLETP